MADLTDRIDEALVAVRAEDPAEFTRLAAEARAGTYTTPAGHAYPALIGHSHTARLLAALDHRRGLPERDARHAGRHEPPAGAASRPVARLLRPGR